MQAHTELRESGTNGPSGLHVVLMTCGTVIAVAIVAATLAWNSGWGHSAANGGTAPSSLATDAVVSPATTTTVQAVSANPRSSERTVYMVGSQAEATRVMDAVAEGNRILDQFGKPPFNADVIVVTSAAEEEAILRANADTDAIRDWLGLPPMKIIDLRGEPTAFRAAMTEADPTLVYVVASQEQAEFVQRLSAELNELRSQLGQRQVKTGVLLANDVTAEMLPQLPGAPGTRFVDLRTNWSSPRAAGRGLAMHDRGE